MDDARLQDIMTQEEQAIAQDFEQGWSTERLTAAEFSWGPQAWLYQLLDSLDAHTRRAFLTRLKTDGVALDALPETLIRRYLAA